MLHSHFNNSVFLTQSKSKHENRVNKAAELIINPLDQITQKASLKGRWSSHGCRCAHRLSHVHKHTRSLAETSRERDEDKGRTALIDEGSSSMMSRSRRFIGCEQPR